MVVKFYIVKVGEELVFEGDGAKEYGDLLSEINNKRISTSILYFKDFALYFERKHGVSVLVGTERNTVGLAKLRAKKLIDSYKKKLKLKSLDDAFELAEKVEEMSLDEFIKFKEGYDDS